MIEIDAPVSEKNQITLQKPIREALGVKAGDRVMLVSDDSGVHIYNALTYALHRFQMQMAGEAGELETPEDVSIWIAEGRKVEGWSQHENHD